MLYRIIWIVALLAAAGFAYQQHTQEQGRVAAAKVAHKDVTTRLSPIDCEEAPEEAIITSELPEPVSAIARIECFNAGHTLVPARQGYIWLHTTKQDGPHVYPDVVSLAADTRTPREAMASGNRFLGHDAHFNSISYEMLEGEQLTDFMGEIPSGFKKLSLDPTLDDIREVIRVDISTASGVDMQLFYATLNEPHQDYMENRVFDGMGYVCNPDCVSWRFFRDMHSRELRRLFEDPTGIPEMLEELDATGAMKAAGEAAREAAGIDSAVDSSAEQAAEAADGGAG